MGVTHSFAKNTTKRWRGHRGREGRGEKRINKNTEMPQNT